MHVYIQRDTYKAALWQGVGVGRGGRWGAVGRYVQEHQEKEGG